jgi:tetratricopeptide (TPR) repeat protein
MTRVLAGRTDERVFSHNGRVFVTRVIGAAIAGAFSVSLTLAPPVWAQITPRAALLEQTGWTAFDAGHPEQAAIAFRDALAEDPKNPRLHVGAGAAAYLLRRDEDAKASLERALDLDPVAPGARELLGRVLYRQGDLDGAIRVYSSITEPPSSAEIVPLLERWRREAELRDRMNVTVGSGFTVAFEGDADAALAAHAVGSLERAANRIGGLLSVFPLQPVPVVLYTGEQFRDITRAPDWAGGAYDGIIRIPMRGALDSKELDRVLAHEFTHALVHTLAPRGVPAWLNEGLAAALQDEAPVAIDAAAANMPLAVLGNSFGRFGGADARRAYATSARAAQRLLELGGGVAVANLLRDLGEGVELETAFARRMPLTFDAFEAGLNVR